ncbi:hypothetical protein F5Y19DRAFT_261264 [Xylariaceae sp. FL1651]|nr:hypothetical protein F5Y19DRAFT_261264 [Xylariaceae sp. FL1651]
MKPTLLPSHKAILAMSRAQYFAHLHSPSQDERNPTSSPNLSDDDDSISDQSLADKVSVGVCIFRLDGRTSRPAVLLLRRSPRWWHHHMSASERRQAGNWELPGGKVKDDDFCISYAIERLVMEQTGLKVVKIVGILKEISWSREIKVLLWDEEDADFDEERDENLVKIKVGMEVYIDDMIEAKKETMGSYDSGEDTLAHFHEHEIDILGIRIANSSSSSSSTSSTPDSYSSLPPLPPPKDDDHDPSLEPAPLSLPFRSAPRPRATTSPGTLVPNSSQRRMPASSPEPYRPIPNGLQDRDRRHAHIIPHKIIQKRYVQLNFSVLVDENPEEEPTPGFFLKSTSDKKEQEYEHDALEWATFNRVESLPMSDDLRRVVHQGLAWAGDFF